MITKKIVDDVKLHSEGTCACHRYLITHLFKIPGKRNWEIFVIIRITYVPNFFTALVTRSHAPRIAGVFVIVFTYLETKEVVNDVIYKHEKRKVCVSGGVIFYKSFLLNWPVTLRKEYSVFARSILRGISGFNRQEVRGSA